jgi:hypothetical protein
VEAATRGSVSAVGSSSVSAQALARRRRGQRGPRDGGGGGSGEVATEPGHDPCIGSCAARPCPGADPGHVWRPRLPGSDAQERVEERDRAIRGGGRQRAVCSSSAAASMPASASARPPSCAQPATIGGSTSGWNWSPTLRPARKAWSPAPERASSVAPGGSVKASSCQANHGRGPPGPRGRVELDPADLAKRRARHRRPEGGRERLRPEAQAQDRHAGVVRATQERHLVGDPAIRRGVDGAVRAQGHHAPKDRGSGQCAHRGRTQDLQLVPAAARPRPDQAGRGVGLLLDDARPGPAGPPRRRDQDSTRNAPRMNGWIRQK